MSYQEEYYKRIMEEYWGRMILPEAYEDPMPMWLNWIFSLWYGALAFVAFGVAVEILFG